MDHGGLDPEPRRPVVGRGGCSRAHTRALRIQPEPSKNIGKRKGSQRAGVKAGAVPSGTPRADWRAAKMVPTAYQGGTHGPLGNCAKQCRKKDRNTVVSMIYVPGGEGEKTHRIPLHGPSGCVTFPPLPFIKSEKTLGITVFLNARHKLRPLGQ